MKKKWAWFLYGFLILVLCCFLDCDIADANRAVMSDGNIIFATDDTKATTNIRWMTAGFTIRKDRSNGNPLKDGKYAVIVLKSKYQEVEDKGGTYHITYTMPKKRVDRALLAAGLDEIEDGDTLYFNTIFKLKVYGVVQGKQYYRLQDIKRAAGWRNPNDFNEHFDIGIKFKSAKYPVTVEYRSFSNEILKEKELPGRKAGETVTVTLDGRKNFGGTEYVLCKSYYVHLSKPEKKKNVIKAAESDYGKSQVQSGKVRIGGMKIVAYMKKKKPDGPEGTPIPTETIEKKIALGSWRRQRS